jgi:hypothetical protein
MIRGYSCPQATFVHTLTTPHPAVLHRPPLWYQQIPVGASIADKPHTSVPTSKTHLRLPTDTERWQRSLQSLTLEFSRSFAVESGGGPFRSHGHSEMVSRNGSGSDAQLLLPPGPPIHWYLGLTSVSFGLNVRGIGGGLLTDIRGCERMPSIGLWCYSC